MNIFYRSLFSLLENLDNLLFKKLITLDWYKKAKFSEYQIMKASHLKRLKELEDENRKINQMYTELSLDHVMLKDVLSKK